MCKKGNPQSKKELFISKEQVTKRNTSQNYREIALWEKYARWTITILITIKIQMLFPWLRHKSLNIIRTLKLWIRFLFRISSSSSSNSSPNTQMFNNRYIHTIIQQESQLINGDKTMYLHPITKVVLTSRISIISRTSLCRQ